ncbi:MAG: aspartate carbamoyltransferase regulatory subunit [Nitrososphaeria archaeon]|nr:aspartate carbamoyltransferase regulatory subunit [Nitrososphaeria archaeon]NIN52112.1 aspartate carbamoyltransferase regulatory subunit [Nitrososphaeria archaeon]NIQ32574.1 aspartate carbamoyltransferase regulatory subunit [Nitrososphaeria archaeon]
MSEKTLIVRKIQNGTVIDHIPAGKGLPVLRVIEAEEGSRGPVVLLMNVESERMSCKDIVKMIDVFPGKKTIEKISLLAPNATLNTIKDSRVVEKKRIDKLKTVTEILRCPNPKCVTNDEREHVTPIFQLMDGDSNLYICLYCDTSVDDDMMPRLLLAGSNQ